MRRLLLPFLMAVAALTFAACDKDDTTTEKRLTKVYALRYDQHWESGEINSTSGSFNEATLDWHNGHLLSFMDSLIVFTYDGDKIRSAILRDGSKPVHAEFSYDGDRVSQIYETTDTKWELVKFTYNGQGELILAEELNGKRITHLTWLDGNVTRVEKTRILSSGDTSTTVFEYIYDNKHTVFAGFEPFALLSGGGTFYLLSKNNVLRETRIEGPYTDVTDHIYTYDGDYPVTERTVYEDNGSSYQAQSFSTNYYRYSDGSGATLPEVVTIAANTSNDTYGEIYGDGQYTKGNTVALKVRPYSGYHFVSWSDGSTDNPRRLTATSDTTFTAVLAAN